MLSTPRTSSVSREFQPIRHCRKRSQSQCLLKHICWNVMKKQKTHSVCYDFPISTNTFISKAVYGTISLNGNCIHISYSSDILIPHLRLKSSRQISTWPNFFVCRSNNRRFGAPYCAFEVTGTRRCASFVVVWQEGGRGGATTKKVKKSVRAMRNNEWTWNFPHKCLLGLTLLARGGGGFQHAVGFLLISP